MIVAGNALIVFDFDQGVGQFNLLKKFNHSVLFYIKISKRVRLGLTYFTTQFTIELCNKIK